METDELNFSDIDLKQNKNKKCSKIFLFLGLLLVSIVILIPLLIVSIKIKDNKKNITNEINEENERKSEINLLYNISNIKSETIILSNQYKIDSSSFEMYIDGNKIVNFTNKYKFNKAGTHNVILKLMKSLNMTNMFNGVANLISVDMISNSKFEITSMISSFSYCTNLKKFSINGFDTQKIYSLNSLFRESGLENIDISNLNVVNVNDTSFMFSRCKYLTSIDLSLFSKNKNKIVKMASMFSNCENLKKIDLSFLQTDNVKDMSGLFMNCFTLPEINVNSFNTRSVENMADMFMGCKALKFLNLSNFQTGQVKDMRQMFYECESLNSLILSPDLFDTRSTIYMGSMFGSCYKLNNIVGINFNINKVVQTSYMFSNCKSLLTLNLSSFNNNLINDTTKMFFNCNLLNNLDVHNFNTKKVTNMEEMFGNLHNIRELKLNNFDSSSCTNAFKMFDNCKNLKTVYIRKNATKIIKEIPKNVTIKYVSELR